MITVQETTIWDGNIPNHKYILSDDKRKMYGYIKLGENYPQLFTRPLDFDPRGRKFVELIRTKDVAEGDQSWTVAGSKGDVYTVTKSGNWYTCTCPASMYRHIECKHIKQFRS